MSQMKPAGGVSPDLLSDGASDSAGEGAPATVSASIRATSRPTDWTARCFQALLIVQVVVAHIKGGNVGLYGPFNLFPFVHVLGFAFVSGYLWSERSERELGRYVLGRMKRLVLPALGINLVYGLITMALNHVTGLTLGLDISLYTLLVAPFTSGHQFKFNDPMWFIMPFATAQVAYACMRALLGWVAERLGRGGRLVDFVALVSCAVLGAVGMATGGADGLSEGWLLFACRTLCFLPWLALGRVYKTLLQERIERVGLVAYFAVVIAAQLVILFLTDGSTSTNPSWCRYPLGPALSYLVVANGIAFWWGACRFVAVRLGAGGRRLVGAVGGNTFSIMCHHLLGFFLVNTVCYACSLLTSGFGLFDVQSYLTSYNYCYFPSNITQFAVVYAVAGIGFSLAVHAAWVRVSGWLRRQLGVTWIGRLRS